MATSTKDPRRELVSLRLRMFAGAALAVTGAIALGYYFWADEAVRSDENVRSAKAIVKSQRVEISGWPGGDGDAPIQRIFHEGFGFADARGTSRTGEDTVSAVFYAAHPVGSTITVYYRPEEADYAVIDQPGRLIRWPVANLVAPGALVLGFGLFLVFWSSRGLVALRVDDAMSHLR